MKQNTNQLFIRQILLILSLTFCNPMHGMDVFENTKTFLYHKFEHKSYFLGKYFVMIAQAIRLQLALCAYKLSPQACDLGIQIATNQLKLIEENLKQDEQDAINDIFTEFAITAEQQSFIRSWIEQVKEFTTKHYQSPAKDATHDPDFPADIFTILENNNINPLSINLKISAKKNSQYNATASVGGLIFENKEYTCKIDPVIKIFKYWFFDMPIECQKATLLHEVEHLRSFHPITASIIEKTVSLLSNKTIADLRNNRSYKKLETIQERQAEIFSAVRNAQYAEILRYKRYCGNYPEHLHLNHLQQLTEIENLHHCLKELKNHKLFLQSPQHQFSPTPRVFRIPQISAEAQQLATE